jgi:hypothetical protein
MVEGAASAKIVLSLQSNGGPRNNGNTFPGLRNYGMAFSGQV